MLGFVGITHDSGQLLVEHADSDRPVGTQLLLHTDMHSQVQERIALPSGRKSFQRSIRFSISRWYSGCCAMMPEISVSSGVACSLARCLRGPSVKTRPDFGAIISKHGAA